MNKTPLSRGFVSLGLILVLVIALAALGGAGWYVSEKSSPPGEVAPAAATTTRGGEPSSTRPITPIINEATQSQNAQSRAQIDTNKSSIFFTGTPTSGMVPLTVNFNGSAVGVAYRIDYGDGNPSEIVNVNCFVRGPCNTINMKVYGIHTYKIPGIYMAKAYVPTGSTETMIGTVTIMVTP